LKYNKQIRKRTAGNKIYTKYYSKDLINFVYDTWKREIDLFGFDFNDPTKRNDALAHNVSNIKVKYFWNTDKFLNE